MAQTRWEQLAGIREEVKKVPLKEGKDSASLPEAGRQDRSESALKANRPKEQDSFQYFEPFLRKMIREELKLALESHDEPDGDEPEPKDDDEGSEEKESPAKFEKKESDDDDGGEEKPSKKKDKDSDKPKGGKPWGMGFGVSAGGNKDDLEGSGKEPVEVIIKGIELPDDGGLEGVSSSPEGLEMEDDFEGGGDMQDGLGAPEQSSTPGPMGNIESDFPAYDELDGDEGGGDEEPISDDTPVEIEVDDEEPGFEDYAASYPLAPASSGPMAAGMTGRHREMRPSPARGPNRRGALPPGAFVGGFGFN